MAEKVISDDDDVTDDQDDDDDDDGGDDDCFWTFAEQWREQAGQDSTLGTTWYYRHNWFTWILYKDMVDIDM